METKKLKDLDFTKDLNMMFLLCVVAEYFKIDADKLHYGGGGDDVLFARKWFCYFAAVYYKCVPWEIAVLLYVRTEAAENMIFEIDAMLDCYSPEFMETERKLRAAILAAENAIDAKIKTETGFSKHLDLEQL